MTTRKARIVRENPSVIEMVVSEEAQRLADENAKLKRELDSAGNNFNALYERFQGLLNSAQNNRPGWMLLTFDAMSNKVTVDNSFQLQPPTAAAMLSEALTQVINGVFGAAQNCFNSMGSNATN